MGRKTRSMEGNLKIQLEKNRKMEMKQKQTGKLYRHTNNWDEINIRVVEGNQLNWYTKDSD